MENFSQSTPALWKHTNEQTQNNKPHIFHIKHHHFVYWKHFTVNAANYTSGVIFSSGSAITQGEYHFFILVYLSLYFTYSHEGSHPHPALVPKVFGQDGSEEKVYMDNFPEHRVRGRTGSSQSERFSDSLIRLYALFFTWILENRKFIWVYRYNGVRAHGSLLTFLKKGCKIVFFLRFRRKPHFDAFFKISVFLLFVFFGILSRIDVFRVNSVKVYARVSFKL